MGKISAEQKLALTNALRSRYDRDQSDLMRREQILYGHTSAGRNRESSYFEYTPDFESAHENDPRKKTGSLPGTFSLRLLAALALAALFILSDRNGREFLGISTAQIYTAIGEDYLNPVDFTP